MLQRGRISYKLLSYILLFVIAFLVYTNYFTKKTEYEEHLKNWLQLKKIPDKQKLKLSAQAKDFIVEAKNNVSLTYLAELKTIPKKQESAFSALAKDIIVEAKNNVSLTYLAELKTIPKKQESAFSALAKDINPKQLIDLTNFHYTINNSLCSSYDKELLAIIIITSYAGHDKVRAVHRQTISQSKLAELGFQRIFLIGELPATERFVKQQQLLDEQQKFGDLLQGNFVDNYYNLSYKNIMGLRWAALECSREKFIIKLDDDIVYDILYIKEYLKLLEVMDSENFIAGFLNIPTDLIRDAETRQNYPSGIYPHYVSGGYYITNPITALRLVRESQQTEFLWIEDIFITGVLRERIHAPLTNLDDIAGFEFEY